MVCKTLVNCNNPSAHRGRRTTQIASGITITIAMTSAAKEIPKCCHNAVSKSLRRSINVCINVCISTSQCPALIMITSWLSMYLIIAYSGQSHSNTHLIVTFVVSHRVETCRWWIPVRQPMRALVRLPGPADNAGTGRTRRTSPLSIVSQSLQSGNRSNGGWTTTYLGTIDHWILWDWSFMQTLDQQQWRFMVFVYR